MWHSECEAPQAYLAGLTFALAASPCSTPVLATLLAYVSTSADPVPGGLLLLTYTSGCEPVPDMKGWACMLKLRLRCHGIHACGLRAWCTRQICHAAASSGDICWGHEVRAGDAAVERMGDTRIRRVAAGGRHILAAVARLPCVSACSLLFVVIQSAGLSKGELNVPGETMWSVALHGRAAMGFLAHSACQPFSCLLQPNTSSIYWLHFRASADWQCVESCIKRCCAISRNRHLATKF